MQKGHHFIAKAHQRQFANPDGQIWVLNSEDGRLYKTNPLNEFKESHYHTVKGSLKAEKIFAQLEGDLAKILQNKIAYPAPLDDSERITIAQYVASMLFRPKPQKEHHMKSWHEVLNMGNQLKDAIKKGHKQPSFPIPDDGKTMSVEDLEKMLKDYSTFHTISTLRIMIDFYPLINAMSWLIFLSPENEEFICSDNPLSMLSPSREKLYGVGSWGSSVGLIDDDVQLTLPLSSKAALYMSWENFTQGYIQATEGQVDNVNRRTARSADKLFASNKQVLENFYNKYRIQKPS